MKYLHSYSQHSLLSGFRTISFTPVLPKVYERLVSSRMSVFMETEGVYRNGLGTCNALLGIVCAGQATLDHGSELINCCAD